MLEQTPGITVRLGVDFFAIRDKLPKHKLLIYTGPIDAYYVSLGMPKLEYRSLRFEKEFHEPESGRALLAAAARLGVSSESTLALPELNVCPTRVPAATGTTRRHCR